MKKLLSVAVFGFFNQGLLWTVPAWSDVDIAWKEKYVTTQVSTGESSERVAVVSARIGDEIARLDWQPYSCIVDREKQSLVWIDHDLRTTSRLTLPLDQAEIFGDLFVAWRNLTPGLRLVEQAEGQAVHGHPTTEVPTTEVQWKSTRGAPMLLKASMGQLPELASREDLVLQLLESCNLFDPILPTWVGQMRAYPGIPLHWSCETQLQAYDVVTTRDFESIKKVESSSEYYEPPGEYSQKPFEIREYVEFHGPDR